MGNIASPSSGLVNQRALRYRLYQAIIENDVAEAKEILKFTSPNFVYADRADDGNRFMKTPLLVAISIQNLQMVGGESVKWVIWG